MSSNYGIRNYQNTIAKNAFGALLGAIGVIFFAGWILFLTYNAFAPDSLPYMGLWTAFGISWLFRYVCSTLRGGSNG